MAAQQLTVSKRHYRDGVVVVAASGELDLATAARLDDCLLDLASTGQHRLVLNAARLTFCDAYGIRVLIRARARAAEKHGWFRLAAAGPQLRRIIEILDLATAFPQFDNVFRAMVDPGEPGSPIRLPRSEDRPLTMPDEFLTRPGADTAPGP